MKGIGKPAGSVYLAMTSKPEYRNRNYLALENADKPEAVYPCVRSGCFEFQDQAGSKIQLRQPTECASAPSPTIVGAPLPAKVVTVWVAVLQCGGARDCVGQNLYSGDKVALQGAVAGWVRGGGGRNGYVRPINPGEQISY